MIYMDFAAFLTFATAATGSILLLDFVRLRKRRYVPPSDIVDTVKQNKILCHLESKTIEYARSFFPVLLAVLLLRSFVAEPFRIPSGSMKPTLFEGDFILVNKFALGLRLPVIGHQIKAMAQPKRGDILVFRYPKDPQVDFIKRVVAVPGDRVMYQDNQLYLNGEAVPLSVKIESYDSDKFGNVWPVTRATETLGSVQHDIYQRINAGVNKAEVIVPKGQYFVMGDNRNNSEDSRVWGFVPEELVIGKAFFVWMSWDHTNKTIRWSRMGKIQ